MTNGKWKFARVSPFVIRDSSFFSHYGFVIRHFPLAVFFALTFLATADAQKTEVQMLSGHGKDDAVPWNFFCTSGANSGVWTNLPVPSQWDVKGFGTLNYHKDLTNAWNERGLYEHDFFVPEKWSGKRIFLVFDGVMTDTDAKLNGQSVGPIHQGSFYRFKYEVTSLMKFGATNKLEVTVAKHSANKSVNDAERLADYWVFGGIFRPVYLEAVPPQFIERVAIDAKADGNFSANVFLDGITNADEVEAQIQTLDGKNAGEKFSAKLERNADLPIGSDANSIETGRSGDRRSKLTAKIASPKLWTAETPNLYRVEVRLKQNGKVIHQITQRFGFRTFEVRDGDGLYLNGQRVILKGADRHSFWPDSGRCLSEAVHRLDINTMRTRT
jgi:beta-galactosidase/beta-glucuronidase